MPIISTIHKSIQQPLSLFQPAVSSPTVPWQWFLTVEILQLKRSGSMFTASRAELNSLSIQLSSLLVTSRQGPLRRHRSPTLACVT
jgi:hypothetical protein